MEESNEIELKKLLIEYSFEDLARSFFILNLWLPNVSSHTKSQYLYVILESIFDKLSSENKIRTYGDFKDLSEKLIPLIPSFHMMEDYLPENDWGEIKYFLNEKLFKIFYGGDLENPYDFIYSFETIHSGFNDFYLEKIGRSPLIELEFCLGLEDSIINGIDKDSQDFSEVEKGDFKVPSETFWNPAMAFLDSFNPVKTYGADIVTRYTKNLDGIPVTEVPSNEDFHEAVHAGTNTPYFFFQKDGKIFPILPRRYFSILFDTWGKIFNENAPEMKSKIELYETKIGVGLYRFIKQRTKEDEVFCYVSAVEAQKDLHKTVFTTVFRSKNKLVLIHVVPPSTQDKNLQDTLDALVPELKEAQKLLSVSPTTVALLSKKQMMQFRSSKDEETSLEPLIITVIPSILTSSTMMLAHPEGLVGEVLGLDQLLGIIDEIEDLDELADFFKYLEELRSTGGMSFNTPLDQFGSFRDSHGVLIEGAMNPDMLMLDMHWGSSFRYKSLSDFWASFPEENFFDHPRGWSINKGALEDGLLMLISRTFFGFTYCSAVKKVSIFINCPVDSLEFEQGKIADSLMHCLVDSFRAYNDLIKDLPFAEQKEKIHILFFPLSLVEKTPKFKHLNHLIPQREDLWSIDVTKLDSNDYGVRVVYHDERVMTALKDAKDRSLQIALFRAILEQINSIFGDRGFTAVIKQLDIEKTKKNRFKMFAVERKVSFPELSKHALPETREFKLADKKMAEITKANAVTPDQYYEGLEAKEKLDLMRSGLVAYVNERVSEFDFKKAVPILIGNIDSLSNQHDRSEALVQNSIDQDVDYEREESAGKHKQDFIHHSKSYRYLVEKFVQLHPTGEKEITDTDIAELLALIDRLLLLYAVSDFLVYGLYSAKIKITHDFLVEINHGEDIGARQKSASEEQAKIRLGMIGNTDDNVSVPFEVSEYIEELDKGFLEDLGFSLKDLVDVHRVLSLWAVHNPDTKDSVYYSATQEDIKKICTDKMTGVNPSTIIPILNFLTLDPEKILLVEGKDILEPDLPVWEHRKRTTRYSLRPLIKVEDMLYWGAYSVQRSQQLWAGIASNNKLPSDINVPTVSETLKKGHDAIEGALQEKIKEITLRFTPSVETEVFPHDLGFCIEDIGDIDVFALLKEKNIILNIESKIIDQAYSNKDLKRIAEKIFGRTKSNGSFQEGYLHMAIKRDALLKEKGKEIAEKFWGSIPEKPQVISVFVTQTSYWWTKYPILESDIHFVEVQMLEDFIKDLLK